MHHSLLPLAPSATCPTLQQFATPLVVAIFLAIPVGVTWIIRRAKSKNEDEAAAPKHPAAAEAPAADAEAPATDGESQEINWDERYEAVSSAAQYCLFTVIPCNRVLLSLNAYCHFDLRYR